MKQSDRNRKQTRSFSVRISGAIVALILGGLLLAAPALATYEQVATFATAGEGAQLEGETRSMAVNRSGAGGVPAGTVYVLPTHLNRVLRYSAKGEFREAWGWHVAEPPADEFERCGPDGEPSHPNCHADSKQENTGSLSRGNGVGQLNNPQAIAVDQATGYVYVLNTTSASPTEGPRRPHDTIQVFNADGSQLIASFGETAPAGETIDESPGKFHGAEPPSMWVDGSGDVHVYDHEGNNGANGGTHQSRIMLFRPQAPGDYEHYAYAGRSEDIDLGKLGYAYTNIARDAAGNLYARYGEEAIYEFTAAEPTNPICEYKLAAGGIAAMTVEPESGEVFYYSAKNRKIHQLSPCDPQGKFVETTAFAATPAPSGSDVIVATLVFNPGLEYDASRPAGALYATLSHQEGGIGSVTNGFIFAPPAVHLPAVESESVSSVTSSTATLGAQINPKGSDTDYAFQYITDAAYQANEPADRFAGASEAPLGGAPLGTGQVGLSAGVSLTGLQPDTEYHYRALATSHCEPEEPANLCEAAGAAQVFRTYPAEAPGLPDGRAYELVSPAQKHGSEVFPANGEAGSCFQCKPVGLGFPMQSSPDGEAVVYEGFPFSQTEGAVQYNEYLSKRTASGWQTTTLSPALQEGGGYKAFDAGLSRGILYQQGPSLSPEAPDGYANLYSQPTGAPAALTALLGAAAPNRPAGTLKLTYAGSSADLSHVFFEANDALTGETPFAPEAVDPGAVKKNLYEEVNGELRLVNVLPGNAETAPGASFGSPVEGAFAEPALFHAISADGSRVFWSDEAGQVYVRENGESTTAIPDPGRFLSAAADGSRVLLDNGHVYDLETEAITDLSEGKGGFQGIAGQSEDLSSVYFVDTAVLDEGENDHGAKAQVGKDNLYAWHEGTSAFIATLLATDNEIVGTFGSGVWNASPAKRPAEASPDGRRLAFVSQAPLSGYQAGSCPKFNGKKIESEPCSEVFLYDSATAKLSCPSCNPSGAHALGGSRLPQINQAEGSQQAPRYLTDSGRLYFDSGDSLSPFDTNSGVEDVYQYEPEGIGSCKREGGCVSLISAGSEPVDSNFLATDESGRSVFFTSRDQLVLKDRDDLIDLYVAREGGGIASETETSRGECQGEACQAAISPPNDPTPGSSTFEGAGNVDEKKASKKHKHKKKHAKKHSAKKHSAKKHAKRSHGRAANHNRGGAK